MSGRELSGRVAVVTGASKGIGAATAVAFAQAGAEVVVGARSSGGGEGSVEATVHAIEAAGGRAVGVRCDVRREAEVERLVATAIEAFGRLDVLVNNAGVYGRAVPTWQLAPERWREVLETNVSGAFLCAHAAIPHMIEAGGGSIVNVTSLAAAYEFPTGVVDIAYTTSKQALDRFTVALARELAPFDIAVNGLSPVQIRTPGTRAGWGEDFDDSEYSEPSAIAAVMVFLAHQRAAFSGHIVRRDEFIDGAYRPLPGDDLARRFGAQAGEPARPLDAGR